MAQKTIKKVCSCVNCGNEAEMAISCTLAPVDETPPVDKKIKGHGVCSSCGNEADIWLDPADLTGI